MTGKSETVPNVVLLFMHYYYYYEFCYFRYAWLSHM